MEDFELFFIGGFFLVYLKNVLFEKEDKVKMIGGGNLIDLTQVNPGMPTKEPEEGIEVFDNKSKKKYSPMFHHPINAKKISTTKSVHLVVPGLLPASNRSWKDYPQDKIFYMPNDKKPHFHGEAQHHDPNSKGFDIEKVFLLSRKGFVNVNNKQIPKYREKLSSFNNGKANTPIETWIHWMIPYDYKDYPTMIVKKDSVLWWDFNNSHNLNIVSKDNYDKKIAEPNNLIKINDNKLQVIVTIMDKIGTFYFLCSVQGHAQSGHRITIKVID